jgi:GntR family transcriptional regulator
MVRATKSTPPPAGYDPLRLPVFADAPLRKLDQENFKETIFRACGRAIHKVDLFTRQELPSPAVAKQIEIGEDQLCAVMRIQAFLGDADPIYFQTIVTPPTSRELHIVSDPRSPGFAV